jgi:hypothetical protein
MMRSLDGMRLSTGLLPNTKVSEVIDRNTFVVIVLYDPRTVSVSAVGEHAYV